MKKLIVAVLIGLFLSSQSAFATFTAPGSNVTKSGINWDGATANAYTTAIVVTDPTANRTLTLPDSNMFVIGTATVATLPTPAAANKGQIYAVTDAVSATDCTIGGASNTVNICFSGGGGAVGNWINLN